MQHPLHTDGYLAIARADAADRQRRADRYRQTRDTATPPRLDRRRASITAIVTAVVSVGIVSLGPTATADEDDVPMTPAKPSITVDEPVVEGRQPGRADGWFVPGEPPSPDRVPPNLR